ncbi:hypothetical protein QYE76_034492 [Lolium multiflorum]|uniref:RING-type E3 ubiquitin transferase n=1 Tax=Lolium multiflorum TaxID=4521 RepID=A0AAD8VLA2_LOLMU|nr:hypothetical protein QYE76_034492 [Lolium multiflorum]
MARGKMALLLVLILLSATLQPSLAQPSNGTTIAGGFTPTNMAMLIAVIAVVVLIALFFLYMNRCTCASTDLLPRRPFRSTAPDDQSLGSDHCRPRGLARELVEAFPTAVYGDVKAHVAPGSKPASLECAVCLAEFVDADELRVLPACCHVFHPGCIDPWLACAVTCPLCRADLTDLTPTGQQEESSGEKGAECSVVSFTAESLGSFSTVRKQELTDADYSLYRRTQSAMGAPDRHTLRLPEHVMKELSAVWRHRRAASLATEHPDAVEQRTPGRLTSFLRSMSWQRHHGTGLEAGEEHGGGNKRIYPVTGATPVETPSESGSGVDEKKESSNVDPLSRV